jgi:hypothetical protein
MSTCYRFTEDFTKEQVLEAMSKVGLTIAPSKDADSSQFLITDGKSYLWAYNDDSTGNVDFCRYGANYDAEDTILAPLAEELDTEYLSEHDDGFFEEDEDEEIDEGDLDS